MQMPYHIDGVFPNAVLLTYISATTAYRRASKSRRAIVISDATAQYNCVGTIVTMQEAGMMVDFAVWDHR